MIEHMFMQRRQQHSQQARCPFVLEKVLDRCELGANDPWFNAVLDSGDI